MHFETNTTENLRSCKEQKFFIVSERKKEKRTISP